MARIRVGYAARAIGTAPVWTACEAGYFSALGLNVEPVLYKGSIATTRALESGEIQLANYAAPAAVQANLERRSNLVVVLGAMNRMMQSLVGRPGVANIDDLRGGTIGVNEWGEVNQWLVEALLPRLGLVAGRDVTVIETGRPTGETWETPRPADAIVLHPPEPRAAEKHGWHVLCDMRTLNVPFQISCVTGRGDWIDAHRPEVALYLQAHTEGILRFNTDRTFGLSVARKWGTPVDEDVLADVWDFASAEFAERPFPTAAAIKGILNAMSGHVPGAQFADPKSFIDDSFLSEMESSGVLASLQKKYGR